MPKKTEVQQPTVKQTKKNKKTYGVTFSVTTDLSLFSLCDSTPLVVEKINGKQILEDVAFAETTNFPNPGATRMVQFYNDNRQFMDERDLKMSTTIIEYLDKYSNTPVAILFPNSLMLHADVVTKEDLRSYLNRPTRHDLDYQMRLRRQMIDKLTRKKKSKQQ